MTNVLDELSFLSQYEQNHISNEMVDDSYYGNYTEYSQNDYAFIGGEISLWRAVLLQHLIDLRIKSKNKKYNAKKRYAYKWFMDKENQNDVKKVCEYAGYGYRNIIKLAKDIINENFSYNTEFNNLV